MSGPHNFPASIVDAGGSQWVFWLGQSGTTLRFFFQRQLGGVWTPPTAAFDATGTIQESLSVVGTPDGAIWLFYSARVSGQFRILLRRFFNGAWEPEVTVSDAGANSNVVAAVDTAGNVMAAWRQTNTGNVLARPFIGTVPQPIVTAATGGVAPARISLLPGVAGAIHLYTVETGAPAGDWTVQTKNWQGVSWSSYTPVATIPVSSFVESTVIRDRTDSTWLIWTTELSAGVSVLRARRITQTAVGDVLQWATGSPRQPAAMRDSNGNLQIFYRNDTHLDMLNVIFEV